MSNRYKTQRKSDEAVDNCLFLKFIPEWFVTGKMVEKHDNALHANDYMLFYNEDFDNVIFITNQSNILTVDLDKNNLENDDNFYEDDPDTIIYVRLLAWRNNFKKRKALKKL